MFIKLFILYYLVFILSSQYIIYLKSGVLITKHAAAAVCSIKRFQKFVFLDIIFINPGKPSIS